MHVVLLNLRSKHVIILDGIADNKEVHVKSGESTETVKPSLVLPMQPGIWTVKIMYLWEVGFV